MKKFDVDVVNCSHFELHCHFYSERLEKFHRTIRSRSFVCLVNSNVCDILVDIGSDLCKISFSKVHNLISEDEYNYLCDRLYNLKRRVLRLMNSNSIN